MKLTPELVELIRYAIQSNVRTGRLCLIVLCRALLIREAMGR